MKRTPAELQRLYDSGVNISELLREEQGLACNSEEIIEIAYDLQTGSYIAAMQRPEVAQHKREYTAALAATLRSLGEPASVLEAGVGEATTLSGVLQGLGPGARGFGFDLSWSRVAYARRWLRDRGLPDVTLCTGSLFHIPFPDSSVDVVYTSHSIEPNGGSELPILQELHRVAARYLVLLEPGYELAGPAARQRMDSHGYCKNLTGAAASLGFRIIEHRLFPHTINPLNPTALTIIEKNGADLAAAPVLACPRFKTPLQTLGGMLFSPEALMVYPIVGGIPCLRIDNGIFASKYAELIG